MRRAAAVLLSTLLAALLLPVALAAPAHADSDFTIEGAITTQPAPKRGAKGAIIGPYATCIYNRWDEPDSYSMVVTQGTRRVASSPEGLAEVPAGRYTVTVTVTCAGKTATRKRDVSVTTYRDSQTVSRAEYKKLHKGQSMKKVRKIIGGKLDYVYSYQGRRYYSKPNTVLYGDVQLSFRKGKLASKYWFAGGHD